MATNRGQIGTGLNWTELTEYSLVSIMTKYLHLYTHQICFDINNHINNKCSFKHNPHPVLLFQTKSNHPLRVLFVTLYLLISFSQIEFTWFHKTQNLELLWWYDLCIIYGSNIKYTQVLSIHDILYATRYISTFFVFAV